MKWFPIDTTYTNHNDDDGSDGRRKSQKWQKSMLKGKEVIILSHKSEYRLLGVISVADHENQKLPFTLELLIRNN